MAVLAIVRPLAAGVAIAFAGCHHDDTQLDTDVGADSDVDSDSDVTDTDDRFPLVAGGAPVIDPELWPDPPLVAWQSPVTSSVFLAEIDPASGQWVPADGRGLKLGRAAPLDGDAGQTPTFNGPEWGDHGEAVFFTGIATDASHQVVAFRRGATSLEHVTGGEGGDGVDRSGVIPQIEPGGDRLAILYFLGPFEDLQFAWRWTDGDDADHLVPAALSADPTPRWIPGEDALAILDDDDDGVAQVSRYALDDGAITPMTTDEGVKTDPFVIADPQGGPRYLVASVADAVPAVFGDLVPGRIAVYREDAPTWTRSRTFGVEDVLGGAPQAIVSLEPFVVDQTLWLSFVGTTGSKRSDPAQVFVAKADGSVIVQLTEGLAPRTDPEVVVIGGEPILYYTEGRRGHTQVHLVRDVLPGTDR